MYIRLRLVHTDFILTRATNSPPPPAIPEGYALWEVNGITDEKFPMLEAFYDAQQFPKQHCRLMVERGGQAVLILQDNSPVASAWLMRKPFYVTEIRRTFDAGADADYYLGDCVDPIHRGRGLQRALIRARLNLSNAAGRSHAIAMTRNTIPVSLGNYLAEGFETAAEFRIQRIFGWEWDRIRRLHPTLPTGKVLR